MIRYFSAIYEPNFKKHTEQEIFTEAVGSFSPQKASCPACGAKGRFSHHGFYKRELITYNRKVLTQEISVPRYNCQSCRRTHAVIPDILIPCGSYSLRFVVTVLKAYFSRSFSGHTVASICTKYQIAVSTLYTWKKLFHAHKSYWLGIIRSLSVSSQEFLEKLACCLELQSSFFIRFGFSFLQNHHASLSSVP
jgi:transposase